ncbi:hypothetical protein, partial [Enterococcus cecorum]
QFCQAQTRERGWGIKWLKMGRARVNFVMLSFVYRVALCLKGKPFYRISQGRFVKNASTN